MNSYYNISVGIRMFWMHTVWILCNMNLERTCVHNAGDVIARYIRAPSIVLYPSLKYIV